MSAGYYKQLIRFHTVFHVACAIAIIEMSDWTGWKTEVVLINSILNRFSHYECFRTQTILTLHIMPASKKALSAGIISVCLNKDTASFINMVSNSILNRFGHPESVLGLKTLLNLHIMPASKKALSVGIISVCLNKDMGNFDGIVSNSIPNRFSHYECIRTNYTHPTHHACFKESLVSWDNISVP